MIPTGVSMVVSGGAVSPENRSNETEIREIAECYLYDGDSDRPLNAGYYALNDVAGLVAAVEQERDAYKRSATAAWEAHEGVSEMYTEAESELDAALARIAAVEATLAAELARFGAIREIRDCLGAGPMDYELFVDELDDILAGTSPRVAVLAASPTPTTEDVAK